jgi:hypothetical protein
MIYEIIDFDGLQITLEEADFEIRSSFIYDKLADESKLVGSHTDRILQVYNSIEGNRLLKYLRDSNPSSVHQIDTPDV